MPAQAEPDYRSSFLAFVESNHRWPVASDETKVEEYSLAIWAKKNGEAKIYFEVLGPAERKLPAVLNPIFDKVLARWVDKTESLPFRVDFVPDKYPEVYKALRTRTIEIGGLLEVYKKYFQFDSLELRKHPVLREAIQNSKEVNEKMAKAGSFLSREIGTEKEMALAKWLITNVGDSTAVYDLVLTPAQRLNPIFLAEAYPNAAVLNWVVEAGRVPAKESKDFLEKKMYEIASSVNPHSTPDALDEIFRRFVSENKRWPTAQDGVSREEQALAKWANKQSKVRLFYEVLSSRERGYTKVIEPIFPEIMRDWAKREKFWPINLASPRKTDSEVYFGLRRQIIKSGGILAVYNDILIPDPGQAGLSEGILNMVDRAKEISERMAASKRYLSFGKSVSPEEKKLAIWIKQVVGDREDVYNLILSPELKARPEFSWVEDPMNALLDWIKENKRWPHDKSKNFLEEKMFNFLSRKVPGNSNAEKKVLIFSKLPPEVQYSVMESLPNVSSFEELNQWLWNHSRWPSQDSPDKVERKLALFMGRNGGQAAIFSQLPEPLKLKPQFIFAVDPKGALRAWVAENRRWPDRKSHARIEIRLANLMERDLNARADVLRAIPPDTVGVLDENSAYFREYLLAEKRVDNSPLARLLTGDREITKKDLADWIRIFKRWPRTNSSSLAYLPKIEKRLGAWIVDHQDELSDIFEKWPKRFPGLPKLYSVYKGNGCSELFSTFDFIEEK